LEDGFWEELKDMAHARRSNLSTLVAQIDQTRTGNLSSAIRVFILEHIRDRER
jgi:predicted DNA-binding ribbon-helix-helix protein